MPGATARLDEWMCEDHRLLPMGHDGCSGAGEPAYEYTGWARESGYRGRAYVVARVLVDVTFHRRERLVRAADHNGRRWAILYADWFAEP
jgi:hypothetical protein